MDFRELQVTRVVEVLLEQLVSLDRLAVQASLDHLGHREPKEIKGHRGLLVMLDRQVHKGSKDSKVVLECWVLKAKRVFRALLEHLVPLANLVFKALKVIQVILDLLDRQVVRDLGDKRAALETKDLRVSRETLVSLDLLEILEHLVQVVLKVRKERLAFKEPVVNLEMLDLVVHLVSKEYKAFRDPKERVDLQELLAIQAKLDSQEIQVCKGFLELKVILVLPVQ